MKFGMGFLRVPTTQAEPRAVTCLKYLKKEDLSLIFFRKEDCTEPTDRFCDLFSISTIKTFRSVFKLEVRTEIQKIPQTFS